MMQAMNTGHDGSMSTIHANSARDALARMEDMMLMANANLPIQAVRSQMTSAVDLIVQTARMRDGVRRVTELVEVVGIEGEIISLETLFSFQYQGENTDGTLRGSFVSSNMRPRFLPRLEYFGLSEAFMTALGPKAAGAK
jgi:pilus assembly protein CpaF